MGYYVSVYKEKISDWDRCNWRTALAGTAYPK